jgi:hypothetical protein
MTLETLIRMNRTMIRTRPRRLRRWSTPSNRIGQVEPAAILHVLRRKRGPQESDASNDRPIIPFGGPGTAVANVVVLAPAHSPLPPLEKGRSRRMLSAAKSASGGRGRGGPRVTPINHPRLAGRAPRNTDQPTAPRREDSALHRSTNCASPGGPRVTPINHPRQPMCRPRVTPTTHLRRPFALTDDIVHADHNRTISSAYAYS